MRQMKPRPGKVQQPSKDPWLWKNLFRQRAQAKFVGKAGTLAELQSEEGQNLVAEAKAEATAALGYSLEDAQKEDTLDDLYSDLQYSKPRPEKGEDEMAAETEAEDVI